MSGNLKNKKKPCDGGCGENQYIWKNHEGKRYCKQCWSAYSSVLKKEQIPTVRQCPIPSRSPKRTKEEKIYQGKRIIFLSEHPVCEMHLPFCTIQSTDVHHMEGRIGELLLDVTKWKAACRACHNWVETHPKEAIELGFSLKRNS